MAPTLGKRKRVSRAELEQASRSLSPSSHSNDSGAEDLQAIFRRAFEAKFKPLPVETKKPKIEEAQIEDENEDEEEEPDWSGISDDESTNQVEVIEFKDTRHARDETEKAEKKAFMTSKPPTSTPSSLAPTKSSSLTVKKSQEDANDPTDKTNLKNDLALQKLLRDSHILSTSSSGTSTPTTSLSAIGSQRHKSTDLHLLTLGAKSSVFTQKNMPMAQRKHEAAKKRGMEEKRRARAKEAGIVLEVQRSSSSEKKGKGKGMGRGEGERGWWAECGEVQGGTLSLSREDVRSITGGRGGKGGKGGKGKGRTGKR
ncbi:pre-rRNA processing and 40S ribosomal subunit assembly [Neocucurbitaria cava]|uniref:Pre-rRNA processing and 40S ribosomal subunit assembly n=1 Tax=Neocucurbitaria cava TaxID=798079 RepID=A0A9W8Y4K5_9PLEO|nr:pre-rRNA processing and 40S ribosomal subunit assembly [Neocucurbitaria cava]